MNESEYKAKFPLHYSVINRNLWNVKYLLANGIDVNQKDNIGNTPLHYSACCHDKSIIGTLLRTEIKVIEKNEFGNTPLHCAAWYQNDNAIKLLIEHKADPLLKNNDGKIPKDFAVGVAKMLLEEAEKKKQTANNKLFILCITKLRTNYTEIAKLLDEGADINGTLQYQSLRTANDNGKSILTKLVELYLITDATDVERTKIVYNMIKNVMTFYCADSYKKDERGNSPISLAESTGRGRELLTMLRQNFASRKDLLMPQSSIDVSDVTQPSTSYWR
ncbi:ankyrin repeat domain-containing protein [Wolbachia endosymbiont of Folsomia candida]|uniref:ankyrin repeat domain-containing protein n=1 Tax=Wolbachia endosymbiont of Folsomia candida TaxID=169402 RepID=UPI000A551BD6|nr:ankyrin repeat domain-containing protein [Wolbachia endosymbiont of Folsomia candida]APR98873.1 hypothetical protein ASM33_06665 [Wolbachia endosymbiont of Folsomia candida]